MQLIHRLTRRSLYRASLALSALLASGPLTGCLAVGYSSRGGFFIWPGSLGLLVLLLLLFLVLRNR